MSNLKCRKKSPYSVLTSPSSQMTNCGCFTVFCPWWAASFKLWALPGAWGNHRPCQLSVVSTDVSVSELACSSFLKMWGSPGAWGNHLPCHASFDLGIAFDCSCIRCTSSVGGSPGAWGNHLPCQGLSSSSGCSRLAPAFFMVFEWQPNCVAQIRHKTINQFGSTSILI